MSRMPWLRMALVGCALWLGLQVAQPASSDLLAIERVLRLHLLCLAPLLLARDEARGAGWVWLAGAIAAGSALGAPGPSAALGGVPWILATALLMGRALRRWRAEGGESCALIVAGRLFLLVGAGWLCFSRSGQPLPGLSRETILLAAIHSHYVGFAGFTLLAACCKGRSPSQRRALLGAGGLLGAGFALTGIGIAAAPALEPWGAGFLVAAFGIYAGLRFFAPVEGEARVLGLLSTLALVVALGWGAARSTEAWGAPVPTRPEMIALHGWCVALGFTLLGAAGALLRGTLPRGGEVPPLVLYDGECGLCDRSVKWILRWDRVGAIRFAALQSEVGTRLLTRHGLTSPSGDFETIVFLDAGGRPHTHFRGALGILRAMGGPWIGLAGLGRVVPRALGDALYRWVSRHRKRFFPPPDSCALPSPAERARFL